MKISKQELAQVIKEELSALTEGDDWYSDEHETLADKKFADSQAGQEQDDDFHSHMDKYGGDYDDPIDAAKYRIGWLIGKFGSNPKMLSVLEDIASLLNKAKPHLPPVKEGDHDDMLVGLNEANFDSQTGLPKNADGLKACANNPECVDRVLKAIGGSSQSDDKKPASGGASSQGSSRSRDIAGLTARRNEKINDIILKLTSMKEKYKDNPDQVDKINKKIQKLKKQKRS